MNATASRKIDIASAQAQHVREVLRREWLLTNGLGGYASGTISGEVTRRYHGLLVAALPGALGRVVMFNQLTESLRLADGRRLCIGGEDLKDDEGEVRCHYVTEFRLEQGLPVWRYEVEGYVIEKSLLLLNGQNTVHVTYHLLATPESHVTLELQPFVNFRHHEADVGTPLPEHYSITLTGRRYEISGAPEFPPLRLYFHAPGLHFAHDEDNVREQSYEWEAARGYRSRGLLWNPGVFSVRLEKDRPVIVVASCEDWNRITAIDGKSAQAADEERRGRLIGAAPEALQSGVSVELLLAADQFIIYPVGREIDSARVSAAGDQLCSVIAGYHWFTDWGRDTMISLEGLTLVTGRHAEAGWILRSFAQFIRNGLIPNLFPEGKRDGLYHTADATLWFFHALGRYLHYTSDWSTLRQLLPRLRDIADRHIAGTDFGIRVDPSDGLLHQGAEGYQLTWMDAKVGDWVVTPRRGKAVEINALWYNALKLLEQWLRREDTDPAAAAQYAAQAEKCRASFNQRFWSPELGYLLDVVDGEHGDDNALRPNQVMAISLEHAVLDPAHWSAVLDRVRQELLTPVGLRSLSRDHPDYKARYHGDLRSRDAAYHQGTVWAWLIGPFIDAWLKAHPQDHATARHWLDGLFEHLDHACVGSVSEVFDAEEPFAPRGCVAQAWSVAELLRCAVKTSPKAESQPS